ncbi:MAG: STAS domain-containing protein [Planctomycetes bacterium]|nr:STAS domain-containing protein [Planctomycetota bacterium]
MSSSNFLRCYSGTLMSIDHFSRDGTLTFQFTDPRITDDAHLQRVFEQLTKQLNKTEEKQVILDFSQVEFMASSMLGKLVQVSKKCKEFRVKLKLCAITPEIFEVFKITKLNKVFDIQPDEKTARKSFNKRGFFG